MLYKINKINKINKIFDYYMYHQKGGLKLKIAGTPHLTALINMLTSPGVFISILSVTSLKGFILIFRVEEEYAEYLMQNDNSGRFIIPVTTYILKLAITNPDEVALEPYAFSTKITESETSFYNEVLLQQNIWVKSITGRKPPICPSIGSFLLFDNSNAKKCLNFLKSLSENELKSYQNGTANGDALTSLGRSMPLRHMANNKSHLFTYLLKQISSPRTSNSGLGMILMQNVPDCETLESFLSKNISSGAPYSYSVVGNARARFNNSMSLLISQIVRLFIEIGVIHFDLHENNELYGGDSLIKKWLLIDFGLASNILLKIPDFYLDVDEKNDAEERKNKFYDDFLDLFSSRGKRGLIDDNTEQKRNFIASVMEFLSRIDREKLKEKYYVNPVKENAAEAQANAAADPANQYLQQELADALAEVAAAEAEPAKNYQMMWFEKLKTLPDFDNILENAFVQLEQNMIINIDRTGMLSSTLESYRSQGILFGSEGQPPSAYYVTFPNIQCTSGSGCTISGGKRKKNKTNKTNKTNKRINKTKKKNKSM
jgi:hypothetical protein